MTITSPRASGRYIRKVPVDYPDQKEWQRFTAEAINQVIDGKINTINTVTLTANATETTITDSRIGPGSVILLCPKTANAAAALATTYMTTGDQTATVNHANNAQTDRTFCYAILGG